MKNLKHHFATERDLDLLAKWNHRLIRDEGHRNPMTVPELRERMRRWLAGGYKAVVFCADSKPLAYALYKETPDEVHLRQLFVQPDRRGHGVGHAALEILRNQCWPGNKRLTVDVLTANHRAVSFWRAVGYSDYSLTLEILPDRHGKTTD